MTLIPTYGKFEVRGTVVGLKSSRAFSEGENDNGNWNRLQFGVKVSHNSIIYVELMGSKSKKIKLYKYNSLSGKIDKNDSIFVDWEEADEYQYNSYRPSQYVRMGVDQSLHEDQIMHPFKAVKHCLEMFTDGQQVLIKGFIQIEEYRGAVQEKFIIKEVYIDNSEIVNKLEAYFQQDIVFVGIEKLNANRYSIHTKLIKKSGMDDYDIIPYTMFINYTESSTKDAITFFENLVYGSTLKVHGNIRSYVPIALSDDGYEVITGSAVRELEITGGSISSLQQGRYTEQQLEPNIIYGSPFEEEDDNSTDVNEWGF